MSSFAFDPAYVAARSVLLDALEALPLHRSSLILVGAQAIYLRVGDAGIDDVVPFTTDADLVIASELLVREPTLASALTTKGFIRGPQPGMWAKTHTVAGSDILSRIDLLVPEAYANSSGRSARLEGLERRDARNTRGLEAVLFDHSPMQIEAIDDPGDGRSFELEVAGAAALLVAKMHKFGERVDQSGQRQRRIAKDALDVHRLLRRETPAALADSLRRLLARGGAIAEVVRHALGVLQREFAAPGARGARLAGDAGQLSLEAAGLPQLTARFARSLLDELGASI